jgi:hypothetical protein
MPVTRRSEFRKKRTPHGRRRADFKHVEGLEERLKKFIDTAL